MRALRADLKIISHARAQRKYFSLLDKQSIKAVRPPRSRAVIEDRGTAYDGYGRAARSPAPSAPRAVCTSRRMHLAPYAPHAVRRGAHSRTTPLRNVHPFKRGYLVFSPAHMRICSQHKSCDHAVNVSCTALFKPISAKKERARRVPFFRPTPLAAARENIARLFYTPSLVRCPSAESVPKPF